MDARSLVLILLGLQLVKLILSFLAGAESAVGLGAEAKFEEGSGSKLLTKPTAAWDPGEVEAGAE